MPVYGEDLDDIVGILYVKDIFYLDEATFSAEKYMREPFFTYESKPLDELLAELKNSPVWRLQSFWMNMAAHPV